MVDALKFFQERFLKNIYLLKEGKKISRKFKKTEFKISTKKSSNTMFNKRNSSTSFASRKFSPSKKTSYNKTLNKNKEIDIKKLKTTLFK